MSPVRAIALMCVAEIVGMLGFATFTALLPTFLAAWRLNGTEAGWLSGLIHVGYMAAVPLLAGLTDRYDARKVYVASALLSAVACAAFALLADGFWSAVPLRLLAGIGLAGTYMPGLKALTERLPERAGPRAVSFYTACFGIGISLSVLFAGQAERLFGWRWAFGLSAAGALLSVGLALRVLRPRPDPGGEARWWPDFRPVFRNRPAMAYVLAYGAHSFELFGLRSWIVAFLGFSLTLQAEPAPLWLDVTVVAALCNLLGMPSSVLGNEVATRHGRPRTVIAFMAGSAAVAALVGFAAPLWWVVVIGLLALHSALVASESSAVTTGTVQAADPARRGATMALHSFVGFGFAFLGSLVPGIVLDFAGGTGSRLAWGLAFLSMAAGALCGPLAVAVLTRRVGTATA